MFPPLRNSICFTDNYNKDIVDPQINKIFNFLCSFGFKFNIICEIKCTNFTWYLKYEGDIDNINIINVIEKLCLDDSLSYLSINGIIYKNKSMLELIDKTYIKYNPLSFRQNDISIKNMVYEILKTTISSKNLYLIGGEMVFYAHLFNTERCIMYTDYMSIYEDAKLNFPENKEIYLINYDKDILKKIDIIEMDKSYSMIINTSKHGIGDNLCKQILNIELNDIIIISCNGKSFSCDFKKLSQKYIIDQIYEIKTNYIVYIYYLKKYN